MVQHVTSCRMQHDAVGVDDQPEVLWPCNSKLRKKIEPCICF